MATHRIKSLIQGELKRLYKYKVTQVSLLVAMIWMVVLYFVEGEIFNQLLPTLILVDATMMSLLYIGSVMFFEKKEGTMSTMLVSPVTHHEMIGSKVIAHTIHNCFSTGLIIIVFVLLKDVQINYFLIIPSIILATFYHAVLGLYISFHQKNFTNLLMSIMSISIVLLIPSILYAINILQGDVWKYLLLINPIHASQIIISQSFILVNIDWTFAFSFIYLLSTLYIIYQYLVIKQFKKYAINMSGV